MGYDEIRNKLALMLRGQQTKFEHPTYIIKVGFNSLGQFLAEVMNKDGTMHAKSQVTESMRDISSFISFYFAPGPNQHYKHVNGQVYHIICIANEKSDRKEYPPTIVYRDQTGQTWAKPMSEFEGKMTRIK